MDMQQALLVYALLARRLPLFSPSDAAVLLSTTVRWHELGSLAGPPVWGAAAADGCTAV